MSKPVNYCITTSQKVSDFLKTRFQQSGYAIEAMEPATTFIQTPQVVLLQSPLYINGQYVATAKFWKSFLAKQFPTTLLFTAGFQRDKHHNHIDLLQWPLDLGERLKSAASAEASWVPIAEGGLDLSQKMHRFFEGHGDESLTDELHKILRVLTMVSDETTHHQVSYEEVYRELIEHSRIQDKWNLLVNRWVNYLPYFQGLPFYPIFEKADKTLKHIAPYFNSACQDEALFQSLDCVSNLRTIKEDLELIDQQYVN